MRYQYSAGDPRKRGSVGRAAGPEIAIMDERGNLLSAGSEGEIVFRGDAVMGDISALRRRMAMSS